MKIDEAREKILAIFSDTAAETVQNGELPDGFMVEFIERTVSICGTKYFKNEYDKEEVLNCLDTLKQSLELYKKTTRSFSKITDDSLPEISTLIETGNDTTIKSASTKLKTIQKTLKEEIISADNAIHVFQDQVERIRKISHFDPVTKLLNAFSFVNDMIPILKVGSRRDLDQGVLMIEVSNYDTIIADHGDVVFNKVLVYITKVLESYVRHENKIYKYNLNTFLILFNRSKPSDLENTEKRIISQVSKNIIEYGKQTIKLTICSAKATHKTGDTIDTLLGRLDETKICFRKE